MNKIGLFMVICGLLSACANHNTVRQHSDVANLAKSISSVVILPADMEINKYDLGGEQETLIDAEMRIQKQIYQLAKKRLEQEGLEVISFDLDQEVDRDPYFAQSIEQCKTAWAKVKQEMYSSDTKQKKQKKQKEYFQASLGSVTKEIYSKTGADAVLLMHYRGIKRSVESKILMSALTVSTPLPISFTQREGATIDVALVATESGQVVWANRKGYAIIDGNPAIMALEEMPDVEWESEINARNPLPQ